MRTPSSPYARGSSETEARHDPISGHSPGVGIERIVDELFFISRKLVVAMRLCLSHRYRIQ